MRTRINLTIDPEVLQQARSRNFNLSRLLEDAIKTALGPQKADPKEELKLKSYVNIARDLGLELEEVKFIVDYNDRNTLETFKLYSSRFDKTLKSWEFVLLKRRVLRALGLLDNKESQPEREIMLERTGEKSPNAAETSL